MGLMVGNFLGVLIVAGAAAFGFESIELAARIFLAVAYSIWVLFLIVDLTGRPSPGTPFCQSLEPTELRIYRNYHTAVDFPLAGHVYAGILNLLRVAGLVYTGLCLWKGLYPEAAGSFIFFILSASLIHRNNPGLFLGQMAKKGHPRALQELEGLEGLIQRQQRHSEADRGSSHEDDNPLD